MNRNFKHIWFLVSGFWLVVLLISGCAQKKVEKEPEAVVPLVRVVTAETADITSKISLTGSVVPWQDSYIAPKISGKVEKIFAEEGERVKKDDPLLLIEKIDYELEVKRAEAALTTAKANFENAVLNFERMKKLVERGTVSKQEYDKFDALYKTSQAAVDDAKAMLEVAKDRLANTVISAPFDGFVASKLTEVGEQVSAAKPVFRITNIDTVKVQTDVPQNFLGKIKTGQAAQIKVDSYPDQVFEGKIYTISPAADIATRTFNVKILVDNPKYLLKGGMFANVDIIFERHKNVLILPRDCLIRRDGKESILVVSDSRIQLRQVEPGILEGNNVEIRSGVSLGDVVVVSGQSGLTEGMLVRVGE